jgi:hypothetical protein
MGKDLSLRIGLDLGLLDMSFISDFEKLKKIFKNFF